MIPQRTIFRKIANLLLVNYVVNYRIHVSIKIVAYFDFHIMYLSLPVTQENIIMVDMGNNV